MTRRLVAIGLIFFCASVAWMVLTATIVSRTADSDSSQRARLGAQWGSAQAQMAPAVVTRVLDADGERVTECVVPIASSRIAVALHLEQRQKGLLWYNLYDVHFSALYGIRNNSPSRKMVFRFAFPSGEANYANFSFRLGGRKIANAASLIQSGIPFELPPGRQTTAEVVYDSNGMDSWQYRFGSDVQGVNDFALDMTTDFDAIDFPTGTISPVAKERTQNGWRLRWAYSSLLTGNGIGMTIPFPRQPGPLAQRLTMWAPIALLFYFFVMIVITTLRKIDLHPINYFFLAAAFFAFHLLFAYLVDRIPLPVAFVACSIVSVFLTVSYLRLVAGLRFAALESGIAQIVYLVLFSYALFYEGWSGLAITIGAIVTLFVAMQSTGRIRWSERTA